MRDFEYQTVDVFTDRQFGGNPLAVFPDAAGLDTAEMQSLAAEMNYSETTFVLPAADPDHTARVRIFNRTSEMPFAGHPNVGTAFVLATSGLAEGDVLEFEEPAGIVTVRLRRTATGIASAEIDAPQPLSTGGELPAAAVAACVGLAEEDIVTSVHPPALASVGLPFYLVQVTPAALRRAAPALAGFQRIAAGSGEPADRLAIHCYARGTEDGVLHARMFAPLSGTWEDPATGSANAALAAFLVARGDLPEVSFEIRQGVEMGRPSNLTATARRESGGIRATVGGSCVPVLHGTAVLR